jgi:hypothetical protein
VLPGQALAGLVLNYNARACVPRVAAGRTVCVQTQSFQSRTRMRLQFSQCTSSSPARSFCMPDDVTVTWQAEH